MPPFSQAFPSLSDAADRLGGQDDLFGRVSKAVRGDRTQLREVLDQLKERAGERLRAERNGAAGPQGGITPAPTRSPARRPPPLPVPAPAGKTRLRLQNGRTVRVTMAPAPARQRDLAALGRATEAGQQRAFAAIEGQGRAIEALAASQRELAAQIARLQEQSDAALAGLLNGLARLRQEAGSTALEQGRALAVERQTARAMAFRQRQALRTQQLAAQLEKVTSVVNSMQVAAYGEKGRLLSTNNLLLAGNHALWSFIDPILKATGFYAGAAPSLLAQLAPLGSLLTARAVIGRRQHVRFVSGEVTIDVSKAPRTATVLLRDEVAPAFFPELAARTDVPVTVVALDFPGSVSLAARVQAGVLTIQATTAGFIAFPAAASPAEIRVSWTIDTGVGDG